MSPPRSAKPIVVASNEQRLPPGAIPPKENATADAPDTTFEAPPPTELGPVWLPQPGGAPVEIDGIDGPAAPVTPAPSTADRLTSIATQAARSVGPGAGPVYGTKAHKVAADAIRALKDPNLHADVRYGTKGSVRSDAVESLKKAPTTRFDHKFGRTNLSKRRERKIRSNLPAGHESIPIIVVRPSATEETQ